MPPSQNALEEKEPEGDKEGGHEESRKYNYDTRSEAILRAQFFKSFLDLAYRIGLSA